MTMRKNQNLLIHQPINLLTSKNGQTLVEVLVAIGVIITVLIAVYTLAGRTIQMGTVSRQKLQAVNLAQEGIEAVRNIRDTNWLEGFDWDDGINPSQKGVVYNDTDEKWEFNRDPNPVEDYFDANCNRVSSGDALFIRTIGIQNLGADKKRIAVTVSWAGGSQQVQLKEDITDWSELE